MNTHRSSCGSHCQETQSAFLGHKINTPPALAQPFRAASATEAWLRTSLPAQQWRAAT